MSLWGDKDPRYNDFPVYLRYLTCNQSYSKMAFRANNGKMNDNGAKNEFIESLKGEGYDAICNLRVAASRWSYILF